MKNNQLLSDLKGKLIISCQASEKEPLYSPEAVLKMAKASLEGGAFALRAEGVTSVRQMKHFFDCPIIGLYKKVYDSSDVYITPTVKEVESIAIAGAEIIATDATLRKRPFDENLKDVLDKIHSFGLISMADISTFEEAINAEKLGFDMVGTTLSGYTPYSTQSKEPDFELLSKITSTLKIPVIMEGKIWEPHQVKESFDRGAYAVVVGSAITRPQLIAQRFSEAIL